MNKVKPVYSVNAEKDSRERDVMIRYSSIRWFYLLFIVVLDLGDGHA